MGYLLFSYNIITVTISYLNNNKTISFTYLKKH